MISITDLLKWAEKMANGRSTTYPKGFIDGSDLAILAGKVLEKEPFIYELEEDSYE